MSINLFLSAGAQRDVKPATVTARQLAAFRAFARERGELLDHDDEDPLVACSFEARVCPWSLASICALLARSADIFLGHPHHPPSNTSSILLSSTPKQFDVFSRNRSH